MSEPRIDLIGLDERDYLKVLDDFSRRADYVVGAVAYWTMPFELFPESFQKLCKNQSSFICVDPSPPTDLKVLCDIKDDVAIYLFKYKNDYEFKEALLHTKMFYFHLNDGENVGIIIGSHNFTRRALLKGNIEHSVAIEIKKNSSLAKNIYGDLNTIKDSGSVRLTMEYCFEEDPPIDLLIIYGYNLGNLHSDQLLLILYKNYEEAIKKELNVHVLAIEIDSTNSYLYKGRVIQVGRFNEIEMSHELTFSKRRYAIKKFRAPCFLNDSTIVDDKILRETSYFNSIEIEKKYKHFSLTEKVTFNKVDLTGAEMVQKLISMVGKFVINNRFSSAKPLDYAMPSAQMELVTSYYEKGGKELSASKVFKGWRTKFKSKAYVNGYFE